MPVIKEAIETQLYLAAPALDALDEAVLTAVLAEGVACLMVDVASFTEAQTDALEQMIAVCDRAECPLVAAGDDAIALDAAKRFALDGVHLTGGPKQIEWARKQIGQDKIVGYGAGTSRHDGLIAAEGGADYVMFGPLSELELELIAWWQAVIETPLVVDSENSLEGVVGIADFAMVSRGFCKENPVAFVREINVRLSA